MPTTIPTAGLSTENAAFVTSDSLLIKEINKPGVKSANKAWGKLNDKRAFSWPGTAAGDKKASDWGSEKSQWRHDPELAKWFTTHYGSHAARELGIDRALSNRSAAIAESTSATSLLSISPIALTVEGEEFARQSMLIREMNKSGSKDPRAAWSRLNMKKNFTWPGNEAGNRKVTDWSKEKAIWRTPGPNSRWFRQYFGDRLANELKIPSVNHTVDDNMRDSQSTPQPSEAPEYSVYEETAFDYTPTDVNSEHPLRSQHKSYLDSLKNKLMQLKPSSPFNRDSYDLCQSPRSQSTGSYKALTETDSRPDPLNTHSDTTAGGSGTTETRDDPSPPPSPQPAQSAQLLPPLQPAQPLQSPEASTFDINNPNEEWTDLGDT